MYLLVGTLHLWVSLHTAGTNCALFCTLLVIRIKVPSFSREIKQLSNSLVAIFTHIELLGLASSKEREYEISKLRLGVQL